MFLRFLLSFCIFEFCYAKSLYYYQENDDDYFYDDVIFSGYYKGDYIILINDGDRNVEAYISKNIKFAKEEFSNGVVAFYQFVCLIPETVTKKAGQSMIERGTSEKYAYVGEVDKNCDCSKWELRGKDGEHCKGMRTYSFEEFQEIAPQVKTYNMTL